MWQMRVFALPQLRMAPRVTWQTRHKPAMGASARVWRLLPDRPRPVVLLVPWTLPLSLRGLRLFLLPPRPGLVGLWRLRRSTRPFPF